MPLRDSICWKVVVWLCLSEVTPVECVKYSSAKSVEFRNIVHLVSCMKSLGQDIRDNPILHATVEPWSS